MLEWQCSNIIHQQKEGLIMWATLISSIFSVLKTHFEEVILRICVWFLSLIACWICMPQEIQDYLFSHPLPALPNYVLFYAFLLTVATCGWQVFFIILDIFFKCHRLSLLLRIKKSSSSAKN